MSQGDPAAKIYALVGPDGAGKTTIARHIAVHLSRDGTKIRISWMRSPRIVALGLILVFRLSGLSQIARVGKYEDAHTDLSRHPMLFHMFAWSVTFDYFLGYFGKVSLPKWVLHRTVICDRFVWDALVDLGLTSGVDEAFLQFPQGQILLKLAMKHRSVLVTSSLEHLLRRRPILSRDPRLVRRLRLYDEFANRFGLGKVDSGTKSEGESASEALRCLGIPTE